MVEQQKTENGQNGAATQEEKKHDVQYADSETAGLVDLALVQTSTGEEGLECIMKLRVKLYRFRDNEWKERGIGNAKLLRDKEKKRVRFLMRQDKTKKPVANFMLADKPLCELTPMANNDKAFVWSCMDYSDGAEAAEKMAARFQNAEAAATFKKSFEAAREFNALARDGKDEELVWADLVEDVDEKEVDDIDTNKTADPEAD